MTPPSLNGSTHQINGAVAEDASGTDNSAVEKSQSIDNGVTLGIHQNGDLDPVLREDSKRHSNSTSLTNRNSSNNRQLSVEDDFSHVISSEDIDLKIELEMPAEDTTPPGLAVGKTAENTTSDIKHSNGSAGKDEVDRAALKLDLSLPEAGLKKEVKIQTPEKLNGVIANGVQDSPSKKVSGGVPVTLAISNAKVKGLGITALLVFSFNRSAYLRYHFIVLVLEWPSTSLLCLGSQL